MGYKKTVGFTNTFKAHKRRLKHKYEKKCVIVPRAWQEECYEKLDGYIWMKIFAPTGSGKSLELIMTSLRLIEEGYKPIIAVPLENIKDGFVEPCKVQRPGRKEVEFWQINDYVEGSKIDGLVDFIKKGKDEMNRVVDCVRLETHQSISRLADLEDKDFIKENNVALIIDEGHHVLNCGNGYANKLGKLVQYFLEEKLPICITTATPFRGDRGEIIPSEYESEFVRFDLSYVRHFEENCKGSEFSYNFLFEEKDYIDAIKTFYKNNDIKKDVIFIPHPSHSAATHYGKHREVEMILDAVSGKSKVCEIQPGIYQFRKNKRIITVVDLVTKKYRKTRTRYINEHPEEVDIVIGIKVTAEGFNWPPANRALIVGHKNSLNELMQMIGRTFRPHEDKEGGKTRIELYHVFPNLNFQAMMDEDEKNLRVSLNNYMKIICMSMLLESITNPIKIELPKQSENKDEVDEFEDIESPLDIIKAKIGETEYFKLFERILDATIDFAADNENLSPKKLDEGYREIIADEIEDIGLAGFGDILTKFFMKMMRRRTKNTVLNALQRVSEGTNVDDIDVDLVKRYGAIGFVLGYTNGSCKVKDLKEFRDLIHGENKSWDEWFDELNQFTKKHGRLPSIKSTDAKERSLARWAAKQRLEYRNMQTK